MSVKSDKCDAKKRAALKAYEEHGTVTLACKAARIHRATWYRWLENDPKFKKKADAAFEAVTDIIELSLYKRAKGYEYTEVKTVTGHNASVTTTVKEVVPDVTAQIFALKNRRPDEWKDKHDIEGNFKGNIEVILPEGMEDD